MFFKLWDLAHKVIVLFFGTKTHDTLDASTVIP